MRCKKEGTIVLWEDIDFAYKEMKVGLKEVNEAGDDGMFS